MDTTNTTIIIGGGVIGLSTAYHLAGKGFGKIILLEKDQVGAGASGRAGGIITGLLWTLTGVAARKISIQRFPQLSEELKGYGYRFQDVGCLNLFDPVSWQEREPLLPLYDQQNVRYELLSATEIRKRWPQLNPRDNVIGLHDPLGGYSEPDRYLPALAAGCRARGVDIREGTMVTEIIMQSGQVTGVKTTSGPLEADAVVSTVHVWTVQLIASLGWQLPMSAFVHQRYLSTPLNEPAIIPAINANPYDGYIRPAAGNRILAGGETSERITFEVPSLAYQMDGLSAPDNLKHELYKNMLELLPDLGKIRWESEQVGLLSFSADDEPIIGEAPHLKNLYFGSSFHSGGFAYSPAAGLLLAELVSAGEAQVNIDAFSPARFDPEMTEKYLTNAYVPKEGVQRRH